MLGLLRLHEKKVYFFFTFLIRSVSFIFHHALCYLGLPEFDWITITFVLPKVFSLNRYDSVLVDVRMLLRFVGIPRGAAGISSQLETSSLVICWAFPLKNMDINTGWLSAAVTRRLVI